MKKYILCLFTFLMLIPFKTKAASANISIDAPSSVYVGDTVKISVTLSSSDSLGSWNYNISYDDSKLSYVSTTANAAQSVADYVSGDGKKSVTYSWTYKATNAGSATFSVSGIDAYAFDESQLSVGGSTKKTIEIKKPNNVSGGNNSGSNNKPSQNYNYSDNNNLSSLNIEGFELEFDKNKTDYSITVPNETKNVKVGATAEDGKAKVNGIGDFEVKEGDNLIEIVVTAENGSKKTYNLNVVVAEATPIEVKVGEDTYNVVRKADLLPNALATFEASTTLIKGEEVPCYHSNITDFYLIGLRDKEGNIELYRYDAKEDKFYVYNQLQLGGIYIALIDTEEIPNGYTKTLIKIGDKEYNGFSKEGTYPLLYGINLETGEKNYYTYDANEGTIQKLLKSAVTSSLPSKTTLVIYILSGICIFEFIMLIASVNSKNKQLKKILNSKLDNKNENKNKYDQNTEKLYNDEKNITDDLTDEYLSNNTLQNAEEQMGKTAIISGKIENVFDNAMNRKDIKKEKKNLNKKRKNKDDDMYKF